MGREGNTEAQREPRALAGTTPCPGPFVRRTLLGGPRPKGCQSAIGIWINAEVKPRSIPIASSSKLLEVKPTKVAA
jgi:hypothetical protein